MVSGGGVEMHSPLPLYLKSHAGPRRSPNLVPGLHSLGLHPGPGRRIPARLARRGNEKQLRAGRAKLAGQPLQFHPPTPRPA